MNVDLTIDGAFRVDTTNLPPEVVKAWTDQHVHRNPAKDSAIRRGAFHRHIPETISTWWRDMNGLVCSPIGGQAILVEELQRWTTAHRDVLINCVVHDKRVVGDRDLPGRLPPLQIKLRPYQEDMKAAMREHGSGIVRAPTGSGKTTVLLSHVVDTGLPTCVLVWNARLQDQWVERARKELGLAPNEIGVVGGGERRLRKLTIAMVQSVSRMKPSDPFFKSFGQVAGDEVQLWAAPTAREVMERFHAAHRIGASADEKRKDKLERMIYEQFGPVIHDATTVDVQSEMEAAGAIVPVDIVFVPTDFAAPWYAPPRGDYSKLLEEMSLDEGRNQLVEMLVNIERRNSATAPIVVMTLRREHAAALAGRLGTNTVMLGGAESKGSFEQAVVDLRDGREKLAVATVQAFGTGIDVPSAEIGILAMPIHANRQLMNQVKGRFCRPWPGKPRGTLYVLYDERVFGDRPVKEIAKAFPGRVFALLGGVGRVPAKEYARSIRAREQQRERDATGGLFE